MKRRTYCAWTVFFVLVLFVIGTRFLNTKSDNDLIKYDRNIRDLSSKEFRVCRRAQNSLIEMGKRRPDIFLPKLREEAHKPHDDQAIALLTHVISLVDPQMYYSMLLDNAAVTNRRFQNVLRYIESKAISSLTLDQKSNLRQVYVARLEGQLSLEERRVVMELLRVIRESSSSSGSL